MVLNYDHSTQSHLYMLDRFQRKRCLLASTIGELYSPLISVIGWVCPSSIILRIYCLRDILLSVSKYSKAILKLIRTLSYSGLIWSEGYSCWKITRRFILEWGQNYVGYGEEIDILVKSIDQGFLETGYCRQGKNYPAPFGYLLDEPLEEYLQKEPISLAMGTYSSVGPVMKVQATRSRVVYKITPMPIRFNTAVPCVEDALQVIEGFPYGFSWYKSEYDKYSRRDTRHFSAFKKVADTIKKERVFVC